MAKPRTKIDPVDSRPFNSPFAHLPGAQAPSSSPPAAAPSSNPIAFDPAQLGKVVLRHERKGRGGKTVTVVSGLPDDAALMHEAARQWRQALGCGATVEDGAVVLQGEQVERLAAWLRARGARQVVEG